MTAPDNAVPDLSGRRVVVTGATGGVGLGLAGRLAAAGAELVLPVRDPAGGRAAIARIRRHTPTATVSLRELDLSCLRSVAALGRTLRDEDRPIHILVNHAGVPAPPTRRATADGYELQFGTNHLGHVALVAHLMPLLRAGRARVTSRISVSARRGTLNWDDLQWDRSYNAGLAHRQSTIAAGLFGLELDRRSRAEGWGVTSNIAHPGIVPAHPPADQDPRGRLVRALSRRGILLGTPDTAPLPALHAATSPHARGGRFYGPNGIGHLSGGPAEQALYPPLRSTADAERLWRISENLTRVSFTGARRCTT